MKSAQILLHGLFIFVGVATTMLGPLLPSLMRRWQLTDSQAGALFTSQFLCAVATSIAVLWLMSRVKTWRLMMLGYLLCGVGAIGLSAPDWRLGFAGASLCGLGLGLINPTANLSAAAMMPGKTAAAVNLLNFFFSIGATLAPPLIGFFVEQGFARWFPLCLAAPLILVSLVAFRLEVPEYASSAGRSATSPVPGALRPASRRLLFATCCMALLFVYVGVEVSMGGWTPTYLLRVATADPAFAASAPAAFWGAMLVSRLLAVFALRYVGTATILAASISVSILGSVLMLQFASPIAIIAAIALAGIGLGPIFANGLGYFLEHYGAGAERITGLLFAAGGVGGGLLPLMIGRISDVSGDLRLALWCIAASSSLMMLMLAAAVRTRPRHLHTTAAPSSPSASV